MWETVPVQGSTQWLQAHGNLRPCAPAVPRRSPGDRLLSDPHVELPRTRRAATSTRSPPSPRSRSPADSPRLPAHAASQQKACALGDDAQACEGDKGGRHQALTVPSEDRPYEMDRAPAVTAIRAWPTKTGCSGAGRGRKEQAEGSGCFPTAPPSGWRPRARARLQRQPGFPMQPTALIGVMEGR